MTELRRLSLEELALRSGEATARLRQWSSLGLIGRLDDEAFQDDDVQRVWLIQHLLRRGITLGVIAQANREQGFLDRYISMMFAKGVSRTYFLAEAAALVEMNADALQRLWEATGFGERRETIEGGDIEALKALKVVQETGLPEDALMQLIRVYGDALWRVAEAEVRLFHFYFHERLQAQGLSVQELWDANDVALEHVVPLIEPLILYFHGKGFAKALREDAVLHLQQQAGRPTNADLPGQLRLAIVFVDLSSFTPLTEAMGDAAAAQVVRRFSELVRGATKRWEGHVVERIGDAFLLVFSHAGQAVACVLEIERLATDEPQFPAVRGGVHWGEVLYREGGYVGSSVNIASRVASEAQRHQVLVTAAVRKEAGALPDATFVSLGNRRLKGLAEEMELFLVEPRVEGTAAPRLVDPVCGMELDAAEVAARLSLEGRDRVFCSQECLQRFVAAPERYARQEGG